MAEMKLAPTEDITLVRNSTLDLIPAASRLKLADTIRDVLARLNNVHDPAGDGLDRVVGDVDDGALSVNRLRRREGIAKRAVRGRGR